MHVFFHKQNELSENKRHGYACVEALYEIISLSPNGKAVTLPGFFFTQQVSLVPNPILPLLSLCNWEPKLLS